MANSNVLKALDFSAIRNSSYIEDYWNICSCEKGRQTKIPIKDTFEILEQYSELGKKQKARGQ